METGPSRLQWLPVIIFVWFPFSFITTYLISVNEGHVYPLFPTISDTGTLPPESCFFGLLINLQALLLTVGIWIRGKQLKELSDALPGIGPGSITNKISCIIGYIACFGLYVVANCQEINAILFHFIGALLAFWGTFFYSVMQTIFSYWLINELNSNLMFYIRLVLCCFQITFNFLTFYAFFVAIKMFKGHGIGGTLQWKPEDPGWGWHLVASISEWLLTFTIGLFILTFRHDFQMVRLKSPQVKLKVHDCSHTNGKADPRKLENNHVDQSTLRY